MNVVRTLFAAIPLLTLLSTGNPASAAPLDDNIHLGVATCANSVCHGRATPAEHSPIAQNEYRIWAKYDPHARAYATLKSPDSQRIAANMGLTDASSAPACLACHSDNVPDTRRGEKFLLSDGIGCEACHGGAQPWIDSHYGEAASHAANLQAGLLKTEDPAVLAQVCQSCHLGNDNQLASHEMMAAGHPRLRFELDTWMALLPAHHQVDDDYRQRKGSSSPVDRWLQGKLVAAHQYLNLLARHATDAALIPELALFDCHSCHRPMNTGITRSAAEASLTPAGTLRINDSELRILQAIAGARDPRLAENIDATLMQLHRAAGNDRGFFLQQVRQMLSNIEVLRQDFARQALRDTEIRRLSRTLLSAAATGQFRDYADAEQLFFALQLLDVEANGSPGNRYDRLFYLLDDEQRFSVDAVAAEVRRLIK